MKQASFAVLAAFSVCASARAQDVTNASVPAPFAVSKSAQLLTGDTWRDRDQLFRLYGIQSCLRGTSAEEPNGNKIDCGNTSLAHLAALFDSAAVTCQPIGYALDKAVFVVCGAQLDGETIDVGTALIATGYAFAATTAKGKAVNENYLVAEINAKMKRTGLWSMTFQHPVQLLLNKRPEIQQ
ncbi:MAG: thermonuclease family protein [Mesorhizobium sp.]|uniref:thermonuclease family protein n=1 Tax=unclassified Mesorhizobium TaxID=325217 RepID=UPI000FC9B4EF|nr:MULTISPECIES: thermonuclease family protein [unclassified Mesorhizobium]RUW82720.1 thermonuclease family protein [Mesorhizobium sp. M1E.F.Ca.ET.063.01.1.1]TIW11327.1 MAG: thermonuclease family protein [Mesorhizobium sp.]